MKSIIQKENECYLCRNFMGVENPGGEKHHIFGGARRKLSEKYGLTVKLCSYHHRDHRYGVTYNEGMSRQLKITAQGKFQERFPQEDFIKIFGRNYE